MTNHHLFSDLESLDESAAHIESIVSSPVRVPIPEQDPTLNRVTFPSRDPSPNRVPTSVRDSSTIQDPIPVEDPIHTENSIPVRSPCPLAQSFSTQVEHAFARFLIFIHYLAENHSRLKEQNQSNVIPPVQQGSVRVPAVVPAAHEESSRANPQKESVPLQEQETAERQQEQETTHVPLSTEPQEVSYAVASSLFRCPDSPRTKSRKEQLDSLGRQNVFIQEAIYALYQVGKEMDLLNLTASEEISSVRGELTKIAEVFRTLPQDLKEAFANFQQLDEQSLIEDQSKLHIIESKMVAGLEYTDSRISDHDVKIRDMSKFVNSLDEKLAKFKKQQDNILKVLRSIDHTVSELNARNGEGNHDANREPAQRSSDQDPQSRRSEHESFRRSSSRPEHQHRY
ncbi:hypothetical protein OROMI_018523 [Orobanche minor]